MANTKHLLIFSFLAVAILVLSTLVQSSNDSSSSHDRVLLARQRNAARFQIPSCSEMVSRSQCSHNPNCKWCNSEVLDDMCFSKAEAWRLPQQDGLVSSVLLSFILLQAAVI
uniref:PSI domain-containing protein n=1 Tax=Salix viminalis TaxID=40686 RepID=A0A6N2NA37_SALVM